MIIQCQGCTSKYFLSSDKVPKKPIKVRCPKCSAVFKLNTAVQTENPVAAAAAVMVESPRVSDSGRPPVQEKAEAVSIEKKSTGKKRPGSGGENKEERAKRLARVLVSDILCYNQEKRDQSLIDGNLMSVLSEEIKKSWELYKEKVGADLANSTGYFKEALNEILADGQKIF